METHPVWRWRGILVAASANTRKKSLDALYSSNFPVAWLLKEVVITGTMLSMVYEWKFFLVSYGMTQVNALTCSTTLKLYASSLWKTFDPMKVKIGITPPRTESGAKRAKSAIRPRAWCETWALLDPVKVSVLVDNMIAQQTSDELHKNI